MKPGTKNTSATGLNDLAATAGLNHGGSMPWLGLGVWQVSSDAETERVVRTGIELGYRSIDTAKIYGNERGVGRAIRTGGVPREKTFYHDESLERRRSRRSGRGGV